MAAAVAVLEATGAMEEAVVVLLLAEEEVLPEGGIWVQEGEEEEGNFHIQEQGQEDHSLLHRRHR